MRKEELLARGVKFFYADTFARPSPLLYRDYRGGERKKIFEISRGRTWSNVPVGHEAAKNNNKKNPRTYFS